MKTMIQIRDKVLNEQVQKLLSDTILNTTHLEPEYRDSYFCWKVQEDFQGEAPEKLIFVKWEEPSGTYYVTWKHWKLLEATKIQNLVESQMEDGED